MAAFNEDTSGQPKQQKPNEYDHLSLSDELEVVAWELSGADEFQKKTPHSADIAYGVYEALVRRSQAHSTIAALRAKLREVVEEREAWLGASIRQQKRARTAEAEVKRLTEEKEALRKGKTEIAMMAVAADGQAQEAYEKLSVAEARIKALEEALEPLVGRMEDEGVILGSDIALITAARAALNSREKAK